VLTKFNKYLESIAANFTRKEWDERGRSPEWRGIPSSPGDEIIYKSKDVPISTILGIYNPEKYKFRMAYNIINYSDKDYTTKNSHYQVFNNFDGVRFRYCKAGKVVYVYCDDFGFIYNDISDENLENAKGDAVHAIVNKIKSLNLPVEHALNYSKPESRSSINAHGCPTNPEEYTDVEKGRDLRNLYK
jgi:hypothetical protein